MKNIFMVILLAVAFTGSADAGSLEKRVEELNRKVATVKIDPEAIDKNVSSEMERKADQIVSLYRSPEYQQKLKQQQSKIRQILGIEGPTEGDAGEDGDRRVSGRSVYIFASSSVPLHTLRNYVASMATLQRYDPVMVFRGFVGGARKIGPTARLIGDLIKVDSDCAMTSGQCDTWPVSVTIDPMKFCQYGIEKVPAVVLDRGAKKEPLILYGDASLEYAIRVFEQEPDAGS